MEEQGCSAESWAAIEVGEGFLVEAVRDVRFYGSVALGDMGGTVEVEEGFARRCGVRNATLRDVSVGNGCLVENVHGYISRYDIADGALVSDVGVVSTQGATTFGEGAVVPVLNEGGGGNVVLCARLTAQLAALMLDHPEVRALALRELAGRPAAERGRIGERARVVGVGELCNVMVGEACDIQGASRLCDSTLLSSDDAPTVVGADAIVVGSVVAQGASVRDGAKLDSCFVGESVRVGRGFSGENSLFFANSHMDNGEACAAFCGPFSCSHHKSTLLIGGRYSFYNAGSATNQSNHAYKMGPIHFGTLERGSKTASGAHILWPARVGAYSMVMGKLTQHPDLSDLPFSYVMASEQRTYVVPGVNLRTVGTWRDVRKWPRRDLRPRQARRDIVNFAFPDPCTVQHAVEGRRLLERLLESDAASDELEYEHCLIRRSAAVRGIRYYDLAVRLFIHGVLAASPGEGNEAGADRWLDVAGMLAPEREVERIVGDVRTGAIGSTDELQVVLRQVHADYAANAYDYAQALMQQLGGSVFVDLDRWMAEAEEAHARWLRMVRDDAEREFQLGDVSEEALREFLRNVE